jgi:hypothetical protein
MRIPGRRFAMAALFALTCLHGRTQTAPSDITDAQIAELRSNMEPGCLDRGRARGAPEHDVVSFCACVTSVLDANVPIETWRQMVRLAAQHKEAEAFQLLGPYAALIQACKEHEAD